MTLTAPYSLTNHYPAPPSDYRIWQWSGGLNYWGNIIQISEIDEYVTLDSDTQNAYKGTANKNSTVSSATFLVLATRKDGNQLERRDHES